MRLNPGITLAYADDVLRRAETTWGNARGAQDYYRTYTDAVHDTYPTLRQAFAAPDLSASLHSTAYWNLLLIGGARPDSGVMTDPDVAANRMRSLHAENQALSTEIENQVKALEQARAELEELKKLAARPGLPVVYDTNMLNHWRQPGDVLWRDVLKAQGEDVPLTRLVIPLRVIDELDRQKYGQGDLAKKAATAIRYLERVLKDSPPGQPVQLRQGATLEVWVDTDDRGGDADLSILRCAADLDNLHQDTGARVLTDDVGFALEKPTGCVAAVEVEGTSLAKMADRARDCLRFLLRAVRIAESGHVQDFQLRFRIGIGYAFDDRLHGWNRRSDDACELALTEQGVKELFGHPALSVPMSGRSDIEEKAALAMGWMERACLTGDNLVAMLYRFFALEALLGDKAEGLKAHGLAFREMMLSHVVEGGFRHPNATFSYYDQIRSVAVHGGQAPDVSKNAADQFEWAVRDALGNYLALAREQGLAKGGKLLTFLDQHPDKPKLLAWIRDYGGSDWNKFLEKEMSAAAVDGASPEAASDGGPA
ncbi:MAG TPA: PIN domain-containing protein [Streptosporangiaceae bacterium]|nr:PIN domain-containing protein [Streptosporangiaceae bacterium]